MVVYLVQSFAGFFDEAALVLGSQVAPGAEHLLEGPVDFAHFGVMAVAGLPHGVKPLAQGLANEDA